jgi:hypothetical protein
MKALLIALTLVTSFTAYATELKFEVSASATDIANAGMQSSMGKSWVKEQSKKNLLKRANETCNSLKANLIELKSVDTTRTVGASNNGALRYHYNANGIAVCDVKEVGLCALEYQKSNPTVSTSYLVGACEMESNDKTGMVNCFRAFADRPDRNATALQAILTSVTGAVGEAEFALCEHAVTNNFDVLYSVLLKNTDASADELLISLHKGIEKAGYEKTKNTMVNFLRSNDVPDSKLAELL